MKNATIAIIMLVGGVAGTVTYYDVASAPEIPQNQIRYEKVDDDTYIKYTITVQQEKFKVSEETKFIDLLDSKISELNRKATLDETEQKQLQVATFMKEQRVNDLLKVKDAGVTGAAKAADVSTADQAQIDSI